jgi:Zn-dependent protease with chaperone function
MRRRRRLAAVLGSLAAVTLGFCVAFSAPTCQVASDCDGPWAFLTEHEELVPATLALLTLSSLLVAAARAYGAAVGLQRALLARPQIPPPARLQEAMHRTGVSQVRCLNDATCAAFCSGLWRPWIYVSHGLLTRLRTSELDAVLLHEGDHVQKREPLARLIGWALAEAFFYLPVLRWWVRRRALDAELRADRAAIAGCGAAAVAGALWVIGDEEQHLSETTAPFGAMAEARLAQLRAQPLPRRPLGPRLLLATLATCSLAVLTTMCLTHDIEHVAPSSWAIARLMD